MFENLINLVRQNAGSAVINNPSIPNEKNEEAVQTAGSSIMATLQNALAGGKLNDVLGFFKNGSSGSPEIVKEAVNGYVSDSFEPEVFAQCLEILSNDVDLYKAISEKNHLIAKENYTSEKVRERILRIIQN